MSDERSPMETLKDEIEFSAERAVRAISGVGLDWSPKRMTTLAESVEELGDLLYGYSKMVMAGEVCDETRARVMMDLRQRGLITGKILTTPPQSKGD